MSQEYSLIDANQCRQHGWRRSADYHFARHHSIAPILMAELNVALPVYSLAFSAVAEGVFQLVAVLGLQQGNNLFVDGDGRWRVNYIPSPYRGYPFALMNVQREGGQSQFMIGFDQRSGLYREAPNAQQDEQRFFDDEGQLQPAMQQVSSFLIETTKNRELTQVAVNALAAAQLLEPWVSPEQQADAGEVLAGLYRVKAQALQAMPGNVLELLQRANALELAYAQLFSMSRLTFLKQLQQIPVPQSRPQAVQTKANPDLAQFAKLLEEKKMTP